MEKYKIPVTWQMIGDLEVIAHSLESALEIVSKINSQNDLPEGKYVGNSFEVQLDFIIEE